MALTRHRDVLAELRRVEPFVYLASPYSKYEKGIHAAFHDICEVAAWLITRRVRLFCPIAHSHPIAMAGLIDPHDHAIWLPADRPLMEAAGGLAIVELPGWQDSFGIAVETETFQQAGKPVWHLPWPEFSASQGCLPD